jgi:hypothetical protein
MFTSQALECEGKSTVQALECRDGIQETMFQILIVAKVFAFLLKFVKPPPSHSDILSLKFV